jgi:hypothetical protein
VNQLRDVNTICRRSWYIAAHVWKIYDFKIEVVPFIINVSTELSNSRYMSKNDADEAVSVVSLNSSSGGYINGRNSANLELLIDKTSSIYLYVKPHESSYLLQAFEETPTHMSIKINQLEEGHTSYPLVCRRPAETASFHYEGMFDP